jgi:hypothetical protein
MSRAISPDKYNGASNIKVTHLAGQVSQAWCLDELVKVGRDLQLQKRWPDES